MLYFTTTTGTSHFEPEYEPPGDSHSWRKDNLFHGEGELEVESVCIELLSELSQRWAGLDLESEDVDHLYSLMPDYLKRAKVFVASGWIESGSDPFAGRLGVIVLASQFVHDENADRELHFPFYISSTGEPPRFHPLLHWVGNYLVDMEEWEHPVELGEHEQAILKIAPTLFRVLVSVGKRNQLQQAIEDWVLQLHHSATPVKIRLIKVNNHELQE